MGIKTLETIDANGVQVYATIMTEGRHLCGKSCIYLTEDFVGPKCTIFGTNLDSTIGGTMIAARPLRCKRCQGETTKAAAKRSQNRGKAAGHDKDEDMELSF